MALTEAVLAAGLRSSAFAPHGGPWRIGAEVEWIPADLDTGWIAPIHPGPGPGTLPMLRELGARLGWEEVDGGGAGPKFGTGDGGWISYEPGGQIEYSAAPCDSVGGLLRALHELSAALAEAAPRHGLLLRECGIDPVTPPDRVPLQLHSERYLRMDRHFATRGPAGARMMRQTAALQVNVDWAADPALHWRVLNAASPLLTALFACSPVYAGRDAGTPTYRALTWAEMDPGRTGLLPATDDPAAGYARFALGAADLLHSPGPPVPFGDRLAAGAATGEQWHAHLTTLFPEVRPKGYAEVRCIDALPAACYAATLVLLAGLAEPHALREADRLLGAPRPDLRTRAAQAGLGDPEVGELATALADLALRGAEACGVERVEPEALGEGWSFVERYTRRGRAPADDLTAVADGAAFRPAALPGSCR